MEKTQRRILCVLPVNARHKALLEQSAGPGTLFCYTAKEAVTEQQLAEAEVILGNLPPHLLPKAKNLRWLQTNSAGVEAYCEPGVLAPQARLTCATGAYGLALSEFMLGQLFCLMKNLHLYRDAQNEHRWMTPLGVQSLWDANVLAVGLGDIGGEFARRCSLLGAKVTGVRRTVREKPDYLERLCTTADLPDLLGAADVVAVSLPGTPATQGMFDTAAFAAMKPGAYFLNIGRGTTVDTNALCAALHSGHLAGAAVDVTDPEPLPGDHPLWAEPNALITPHASGNYTLPETFERVVAIAADNLARYAAGAPLHNLVDPRTRYRKPEEHK